MQLPPSIIPKKRLLAKIWELLKNTVLKFREDNTMNHAAALAYYTIFSLPPLLILVIHASGVFLRGDQVQNDIFNQLGSMIGWTSIQELKDTINKIGFLKSSYLSTVISMVTLFLTSTSLFMTIQTSLNIIFKVKAKPKRGYVKMLRDRAISFAMIIGLSLALIASLLLETGLKFFGHYIDELLPRSGALLVHGCTMLIPFFIVSILFTFIFKYLPDIRIKWKDTVVGAIVTSLLFSGGKILIGYYVSKTNVGSIYDAAGSVLVLLVWIFYTSTIFFFGAQFTYVYARLFGAHIRPATYAVRVVQKELEVDEEMP